MPMWKIIIHVFGIFNEPVTAGMDNAGKSRSGICDAYSVFPKKYSRSFATELARQLL